MLTGSEDTRTKKRYKIVASHQVQSVRRYEDYISDRIFDSRVE